MTKTEHYNLPQWEKTDRVLMEDFNEAFLQLEHRIPHIAVGTYTGTGSYSAQMPNALSFTFQPTLVLLSDPHGQFINFAALPAVSTPTSIYTVSNSNLSLKWEGNTVYWWSSRDAQEQFNQENTIYYYVAM